MSEAKQMPPTVETTDERLQTLESLQRDTDAEMGHRTELLREKVEALEQSRARWVAWAQDETKRVAYLSDRLDAALKRIEQLEHVIGMSARENQYDISKRPIAPIDQEDV